jgi:hypothetical protein
VLVGSVRWSTTGFLTLALAQIFTLRSMHAPRPGSSRVNSGRVPLTQPGGGGGGGGGRGYLHVFTFRRTVLQLHPARKQNVRDGLQGNSQFYLLW